jgi:ribose transport system permease protein
MLAYGIMVVLFAAAVAISPGFAQPGQLRQILILSAFIGVAGIGQTLVIIGGGIDLSVPWTLNGAAVLAAVLSRGSNGATVWVVPALLGIGALAGAVNGFGVAWLRVPPIVMTLGTYAILQGALLVVTHGTTGGTSPRMLADLASLRWLGLPPAVWLWLLLAIVVCFVLTRTVYGRRLYAVGTNPQVAELSGVNARSAILVTYVVSGLSAALAGLLLVGYVGNAYLGMGDPYLFSAVAAVAIGGASILGGSGHYAGTIAGAISLTLINVVLPVLGLKPSLLQIIYGAVILVAVAVTSLRTGDRTTEA